MGCYTSKDQSLTICTGRLREQKPYLWAKQLERGLCPKCTGNVHVISPAMFSDDYDSMSINYICEDCERIFDWPHSYIAQAGMKIRVVRFPSWVTSNLVKRFNVWEARGGCDERGRFAKNPLKEIE